MQLKDNLYNIVTSQVTQEGFHFIVSLNPECFIYKAHFPDFPITPGVCLMQMAQELCSEALGVTLTTSRAGNIKFLRGIVPAEMPELNIHISRIMRSETLVSAHIAVECNNETAAKLSMTFRQVQ